MTDDDITWSEIFWGIWPGILLGIVFLVLVCALAVEVYSIAESVL